MLQVQVLCPQSAENLVLKQEERAATETSSLVVHPEEVVVCQDHQMTAALLGSADPRMHPEFSVANPEETRSASFV